MNTTGLEALIEAAKQARSRAYAPFSKFQVGAALETEDGQIVTGCNCESASYGLTICAERVAIFKAISEGAKQAKRIVILANTETLTPPCGACRQWLWEFGQDMEVILVNLDGVSANYRLSTLLPWPFDARLLS